MTEFWEAAFVDKQAMWGLTPAQSAVLAKDQFLAQGARTVLIPGIGYGRNAAVFVDAGMDVTGIEISETAIDIANRHFEPNLTIYHGSVTDMPFDDQPYDGIFCFALIHLLDAPERTKLIRDCYDQLGPGGSMVFVTIAKEAPMYGKGMPVGTDRFETADGVRLFFYDADSVQQEFGQYGLAAMAEVDEPNTRAPDQPAMPFLMVTCRK